MSLFFVIWKIVQHKGLKYTQEIGEHCSFGLLHVIYDLKFETKCQLIIYMDIKSMVCTVWCVMYENAKAWLVRWVVMCVGEKLHHFVWFSSIWKYIYIKSQYRGIGYSIGKKEWVAEIKTSRTNCEIDNFLPRRHHVIQHNRAMMEDDKWQHLLLLRSWLHDSTSRLHILMVIIISIIRHSVPSIEFFIKM